MRAADCLTLVFGFVVAATSASAGQPATEAAPSAPQSYKLKLLSFVPEPGRAVGVYLKVRINGGRTVRLLLDSGAEHLVVSTAVARSAGLPAGAHLSLIGFGEQPDEGGFHTVARSVEVGPLTLRDCPVDVVDHKVVNGADGVVPLALFSDFLVRLDLPGKVLELTPYESATVPRERFTGALAVNAVLLLRTVLNGLHDGYYLLDTGAAHNALSRTTAREMGGPGPGSEMRRVQGAAGASEVPQMRYAVHFRTAGQDIVSDDVVLVDLDTFSRYNGVKVAGLLGYPALSRYVLTVDYRHALVRMQAAGEE
jgi:hypothetical protein